MTVQGRAEFVPEAALRQVLVERFHAKYDPDIARLWANRVMFRIAPSRVRSWGLGV